MGKVKCYIDAENLSVEEVYKFIGDVKGRVRQWESLDCKVYGRQSKLRLFQGLEEETVTLVETANTRRKKTADVTIVTQAAIESVIEKDISIVWLFTRDCDFQPLVDTLTSFGIIVKAPLLEGKGCYTIFDIDKRLKSLGWDPMAEGISAFYCQRESIRALLGGEFSDELIDKYLEKKKKNFLKEVTIACGSEMARELQRCETFDFREVVSRWSGSLELLERLAKCYTSKFYSLCFRKKDNQQFVERMLAEQ